MKNIIIFLCAMSLMGCNKENPAKDLFYCEGLPDENQSFYYMVFENENRGYLFGTLTGDSEGNDKNIGHGGEITEANIYKTDDGGHSWKKIDEITNYGYINGGYYRNGNVYIVRKSSVENFKNIIQRVNLENLQKDNSAVIQSISAFWLNDKGEVIFSNNRGKLKLSFLSDSLAFKHDMPIQNYLLKGIPYEDSIYCLFTTDEDIYFGYYKSNNGPHEINLPIKPKDIIIHDGKIIIVGTNKKDNAISFLAYNPQNNDFEVIKQFNGYSIIEGLQANDKIIAAFAGNISGSFIEYNLIYSTDKAKSWKKIKLKEQNYVSPSYLIGNIIYIYSGGNRMQKIELE